MPAEPSAATRRLLIGRIMAALALWGVILSIGVFLKTRSILAAALIVGAVCLFVGGWGLAIWLRKGRLRRKAGQEGTARRGMEHENVGPGGSEPLPDVRSIDST